jgi:hypothetical protein
MKPMPRKLTLKIFDVLGAEVEQWTMVAVPGAMGFSELDVREDGPWVTQIAFSATEINIDPTKR